MVSSVSSRAPEAGRVIGDVSVASQSGSRVSADDPDAWDGYEARDDRDCHGDRLVSREERDGCLSQLVYHLGDGASDDKTDWVRTTKQSAVYVLTQDALTQKTRLNFRGLQSP